MLICRNAGGGHGQRMVGNIPVLHPRIQYSDLSPICIGQLSLKKLRWMEKCEVLQLKTAAKINTAEAQSVQIS